MAIAINVSGTASLFLTTISNALGDVAALRARESERPQTVIKERVQATASHLAVSHEPSDLPREVYTTLFEQVHPLMTDLETILMVAREARGDFDQEIEQLRPDQVRELAFLLYELSTPMEIPSDGGDGHAYDVFRRISRLNQRQEVFNLSIHLFELAAQQ